MNTIPTGGVTASVFTRVGSVELEATEVIEVAPGGKVDAKLMVARPQGERFDYEITWRLADGSTVRSGRLSGDGNLLFLDELPGPALYHSILELHGMQEVGEKCRAALRKFDVKAMSEAVPDALVEEIAIACTRDEARDRLSQWKDLTDQPLLYAPTVGVPPERVRANVDAMFEIFGAPV